MQIKLFDQFKWFLSPEFKQLRDKRERKNFTPLLVEKNSIQNWIVRHEVERGIYRIYIRTMLKTVDVDSKMIDLAVDELSRLMVRLDRNPRKRERIKTPSRRLKRFGRRYRILSFMQS